MTVNPHNAIKEDNYDDNAAVVEVDFNDVKTGYGDSFLGKTRSQIVQAPRGWGLGWGW